MYCPVGQLEKQSNISVILTIMTNIVMVAKYIRKQHKTISSTLTTSRSIVVNGAIMNGGRVIHQKINTKDSIHYSCYENKHVSGYISIMSPRIKVSTYNPTTFISA